MKISRLASKRVLSLGLVGMILLAAAFGAGCAKLLDPGAAGSKPTGVAGAAVQTLELPVPDNSFLAQKQSDILPSTGQNLGALLTTIINPIAKGLQEQNMRLAQTIVEGTKSNNGLNITDSALGTTLAGSISGTTLGYTYLMNSITYFTATIQAGGVSGIFNFPASNSPVVWSAFSVTFTAQADTTGRITKTVVVNNTSAGTLTFTIIYPPGSSSPVSVTFTGTVSGKSVSGAWTALNGFFFDLGGAKKCFQFLGGTWQDTVGC